MPENRKIVRVFLASPGDLQDERRAAKLAVDQFNATWAQALDYQIELVGWEETVSSFGRPQSIINNELERCELFIGMLWRRWGTPPDSDGVYGSGFEEEFSLSLDRRKRTGRPEISLYFKEIDEDALRDPGDELKKVLKFRKHIETERILLYETFADPSRLSARIGHCVSVYVQQLRANEARRTEPEAQLGAKKKSREPLKTEAVLSAQGLAFAKEFIETLGSTGANYSRVDAARFRLLGCILGDPNNDAHILSVHDANLIFMHRSELTLGPSEKLGLLEAGIANVLNENTPIWHWLSSMDGFQRATLSKLAALERDVDLQRGALVGMKILSEPLPDDINREALLKAWFTGTGNPLKVAALEYLAECGNEADLPVLKEEFDRADVQTTSTAIDAILRINIRVGREQALNCLNELQPATLSRKVFEAIFDYADSFDTATLVTALAHKNYRVRLAAARQLVKRKSLNDVAAQRLIDDEHAQVRLEGMKALAIAGKTFSESESKKILVRSSDAKSNSLAGILSGFDTVGLDCWDEYHRFELAMLSDAELKSQLELESVFKRDAYFVFAERHFSSERGKLRSAIEDNFLHEYRLGIDDLAKKYGQNSKLVEQNETLEEYLRKKYTRTALNIICRKGYPEDLRLVRRALRDGSMTPCELDFSYLGKCGEWQDVSLIVELLERSQSQRLLRDVSLYKIASRAILAIGRSRTSELVKQTLPNKLLVEIIELMPNEAFAKLSDATILKLLANDDDSVRKISAIKCTRATPKTRMRSLLDQYLNATGPHYYNAIHWLDFGISVPRARAIARNIH